MRRSSLIWGLLIILAGVLFMLDNLGFLRGVSAWALIGPIALILVGLWFLFGPRWAARRPAETRQLTIPLGGAQQAVVELNHGAGRLEIYDQAAPGTLLSGVFTGGVEEQVHSEGPQTWVKLGAPFDTIFPGGWMGGQGGLTWRVLLTPEVPLRLTLHTGASETAADLTNLRVTDLKLETGASSTDLTLPARAGATQVKVSSGAAKISLRVPTGVAARIKVESGLSGIDIDPLRFPRAGDEYLSPDYATAANRVDIRVETGVGSVIIR